MVVRVPSTQTEVIYPESDGQPMADNTVQFRWIVTLHGGLAALFRDRDDVFPLLGIRFEIGAEELVVYRPNRSVDRGTIRGYIAEIRCP